MTDYSKLTMEQLFTENARLIAESDILDVETDEISKQGDEIETAAIPNIEKINKLRELTVALTQYKVRYTEINTALRGINTELKRRAGIPQSS